MARILYAAASLLLLLAPAVAQKAVWPFGLAEEGCPPVPADLLEFFTVGGTTGNTTTLTKGQAANLACNLLGLLGRDTAGNATASAALNIMYTAWRAAYRPQEWQPTAQKTVKSNWMANLLAIAQTNQLMSLRWWARLNTYSEMSSAEFAATVLMRANASSPSTLATASTIRNRKLLARGESALPTQTYPASVNWTTAGKVLPAVGFQRQCGSSWAFASAAAMESRLLIATNASMNATAALSPQHIMDCTANMFGYKSSACTGGSATDAFAFAAAAGVAADKAYRYRAEHSGKDVLARGFTLQCNRAVLTGLAAKMGTVQVTSTAAPATAVPATKLGLITALAQQPAVSTLWVDASFQHYHAGIWSSTACVAGVSPAQAVLVVGYDTTRLGWEYFLAKNSLGTSWGERGMVRLAMTEGEGTCGMYRAARQPGAVTALAAAKLNDKQAA